MTNPLAFIFPGQGSQSVGMLADIAAEFDEVLQTFNEASDVLGYDLWKMALIGPAEELDQTIHTQPAILTASYALWRIIQSRKPVVPAMLAGHSLGEYTALVCANVLSFTDAIRLVAARGQFMQDAVAPGVGAMAAIIGLEDVMVLDICRQAVTSEGEVLAPANYNSQGQVVIAGHTAAVERAVALAKTKGAKLAIMIPVSVPSHCKLMIPAAERLAEWLTTIQLHPPAIPVINNVDVTAYSSVDSIWEGLVRQLYSPVRWLEIMQHFIGMGVTQVVECGPGKVLTGLNKRIDKTLQVITTADAAGLNAFLRLENEGSA